MTVYLVQRGNEWLPDVFTSWTDAFARFMQTVNRWQADGCRVSIEANGPYFLAIVPDGPTWQTVRVFSSEVK